MHHLNLEYLCCGCLKISPQGIRNCKPNWQSLRSFNKHVNKHELALILILCILVCGRFQQYLKMDNDIYANKFAPPKIRFEFQLVFYIALACLSSLEYIT